MPVSYTFGIHKGVIMTRTKTAISLKESLFEQADAIAQEMNISRSQLFSIAVEEFIERHQSQKMLEALNEVYEDGPDASEQQLLREAKAKYRQMFEDEW
jgi:metal-responsive CopG/Arc/MetJ family transcriptional regulator